MIVSISLLLVLAACGDDEGGSGDDDASEQPTATAADDTTADPTTAETDAPPDATEAAGADDPWCAVARDLNDALELEAAQSGTPEGLETAFTEIADVIDTAEEVAPAEISDQVVALGNAFDGLIAAFDEVDWDVGAITDEVGEELSEPIDAALPDITEFNEELCGLTSEAECAAMRQTLEVAVEAHIASEGRPPVDEQELIDAGFIREDTEGYDVVDGEIVTTVGGGCE